MESYDDTILETDDKMDKSVDHFRTTLRGMRTGRASPALVDGIKIEYYGTQTNLKEIATIMAPEANLLVVKPFDPSSLSDIEKGIMKSDLGINPQSDGKVIRLVVPPLSEERRKKLVTRAKELAEETRIAIRNIRRDGNKNADKLKKESTLTEDEQHKLKDEVQDLTKNYEGQVDKLLEDKTKELMEI